jgi:cellulose synthase/poly-beta-1,6-N-acetylglucosamine synthase-like glycosyltransferase
MSSPRTAEYEQLTFPRARRCAQPGGSRATILRTRLSRLDYHALMKADVDTGTGTPRQQPNYSPGQIAVCLTAYNEDVEAYHDSLAALARGADHFVGAGEPRMAREFTICILVDGLERMSAGFADYARRLGIYQPALIDRAADYHVFETTIDRHLLQVHPRDLDDQRDLAAAEARLAGTLANLSPDSNRQRVLLFIKAQNRGKLDSHRCFFEVACRRERPGYFLQVDVGTTPDANAIFEMWRSLAASAHVAAVSARSHMPQPRGADLLGAWQYGDIAIERILLWPTEVLMGYMSVLSGQFCLTRSDAVWRRHDAAPAAGAAVPVAEDGRVMRSYLRGLEHLGPFESNMFLAEDRILGLEIVFQTDSRWELGYVPTANAGIDRCETWNELLCQRRRWKCSSVACRLWMFTRVLDYVKSTKRSLAQRSRIVSATVFHSLYFLVEWLMPAFALMIFSSLHGIAAAHATGALATGIDVAYWALLALLLVQLGVSATGRNSATTNRFYGISVVLQTGYTLAMAGLAAFLARGSPGFTGTLLLGGVAVGSVMLLGRGYASEIFQGLKRSLLTYWPARPAVAFLIMTYAALNSHDTSWGTKGLTRPDYLDEGGDSRPRRFRKEHFSRFRARTVGLMLAANAGFFAFAQSHGWMDSFTGLRVVLGLVLAQVAVAWLGRLAIALEDRGR